MKAVDGFSDGPEILSSESIKFMTDNANEYAPIGWKATNEDGNWWRTGSFPGSAGMLKRQSDGTEWVVLLNSSAWNGPEIFSYINGMMSRVLMQVRNWPEEDLFKYSLPLPLKTEIPDLSVN